MSRNNQTWPRRREEFLRNVLRRASMRWPGASEARKLGRTCRRINSDTGRIAWHALCVECMSELPERYLDLDHTLPVVPVDRPHNVGAYSSTQLGKLVERMLPAPSGYRLLCRDCHKTKTRAENEARRKFKEEQT